MLTVAFFHAEGKWLTRVTDVPRIGDKVFGPWGEAKVVEVEWTYAFPPDQVFGISVPNEALVNVRVWLDTGRPS